ncbi:MAG: hypothetical protein ACOH2C_13680 [Clostridium sp.]
MFEIIKTVEKVAIEQKLDEIDTIVLEVGELSSIVPIIIALTLVFLKYLVYSFEQIELTFILDEPFLYSTKSFFISIGKLSECKL